MFQIIINIFPFLVINKQKTNPRNATIEGDFILYITILWELTWYWPKVLSYRKSSWDFSSQPLVQCTANVKSLLPLPKPNKYTNQSQLVDNDEIYLLKDIYCKIFKMEINIGYLLIWIVYAYICQFYLMLFKLHYILI